jgi:hypothetical protein
VLRGGVGNVLYFFLWTALIAIGAASLDKVGPDPGWHVFTDWTGLVSVMSQMQAQVRRIDPLYNGSAAFNIGPFNPATKTFLWTGFHWSPEIFLSRAALLGFAVLLALLAALFFDRFDPARRGWLKTNKQKPVRRGETAELLLAPLLATPSAQSLHHFQMASHSIAHLPPVSHPGSRQVSRMRISALVLAELRLMLKGHAWWWKAVAAALWIACVASPLTQARSDAIVFAWLWPVLLWSPMGTRETQWNTGALIFSAPRAVPRQFLAIYVAGVLVAVLTGSGLGLHLLMARDFDGLAAWVAGACFIPAMALALGAVSGTRKFFEALYTAWWYIGPLHHIRGLDFMGTTAQSSTPAGYLAAAAVLLLAAYSWRKVKLAHS